MKKLSIGTVVVATTLAAAFVLSGCGSDDRDSDGDDRKPFASSSNEAAADENAPLEPNLGDRALTVGEAREGREVTTTLHEVQYPYPPGEYRVPEAGNVFVGLRIEQCLSEDSTTESASTYNGEWSIVTANGEEYTAGSTWIDWPEPKFPEMVVMIPGRCMTGWINLEVPEGVEFEAILWRAGGTPVAEWLPA